MKIKGLGKSTTRLVEEALKYRDEGEFEIWYLLHFNFYNSAMSRQVYQKKLTECLGFEYAKSSYTIYEVLESRKKEAIRNADRLLDSYSPVDPAYNNPSTTIHHLIRELN